MTAADTFTATVSSLAEGNAVDPAEQVGVGILELIQALEDVGPAAPDGDGADIWSSRLEELLALALPTVRYGDRIGEQAVVSALRQFGREQAAFENSPVQPVANLVLHHFTWAIVAHELACDHTSLLPLFARIPVPSGYGPVDWVFESSGLRHNSVFDRDAGLTYHHCRDWLAGLDLRPSLSRWRRDTDLESSLAEAELVAALVFARRHGESRDSFSQVVGTDGIPEGRLAERLADDSARQDLCRLFGVETDRLRSLLDELYGRIQGPNRFARGSLFSALER